MRIKTVDYGWGKRLEVRLKRLEPQGSAMVLPVQSDLSPLTLNYALTSEPIFSPSTTRRILPRWFRLKTMIGRLLSLHNEMAALAITFRPPFLTSLWVLVETLFAAFPFFWSASSMPSPFCCFLFTITFIFL